MYLNIDIINLKKKEMKKENKLINTSFISNKCHEKSLKTYTIMSNLNNN